MAETVNIYVAKTQLSRLVDRAREGEEIVIARNGRPVARLCALVPETSRITFGRLKGAVHLAADFDAPLPAEVLGSFEGEA